MPGLSYIADGDGERRCWHRPRGDLWCWPLVKRTRRSTPHTLAGISRGRMLLIATVARLAVRLYLVQYLLTVKLSNQDYSTSGLAPLPKLPGKSSGGASFSLKTCRGDRITNFPHIKQKLLPCTSINFTEHLLKTSMVQRSCKLAKYRENLNFERRIFPGVW